MTATGNLHRTALAHRLGQPPRHYDLVLDQLTVGQRAWTRRRIHAARRSWLLGWAATLAAFLVAATSVVYIYASVGWRAAVVAAVLIAAVALVGDRRAAR